jgi:hypothetical protein
MKAGDRFVNRDTGRRIIVTGSDKRSVDFVYVDDDTRRPYWTLVRYWGDFWREEGDGVGAIVDQACDCCRPRLEAAIRAYLAA